MTKHARQFAIRQIIGGMEISSQDELRRELRKKGFSATQATLSRDLKDLGVSWVPGAEKGRYTIGPAAEAGIPRPIAGAEVVSIDASEAMIVIRTLPGCANAVGEFIDTQRHRDIIGTIAGDNTLLVVPRTQKKTKEIVEFLTHKLIEGAS